ncbi:hydantoinase/carbamoylase family amidase [Virgibacillus necropolis]|uniref:Zn-dependent hydrolase n=1 Tax=Virgibacillus necropolis TaxID=163877 RepID=A0A221MFF8_9BACI|nr:hydantoinase/carbamoylase family amidase [Virgibacillus necropolis]ASN06374.1 Zn-dependent hydrolase [Virgibacillus necropolis]
MKINKQRLMTMLDEVNQITSESEGVTRLAYSEQEEAALDWFIDKCEAHDIRTYRDAIGNVFGTIGPEGEKGVLIGSHLDTVKDGGKYDGALGVVAGLEVLMTLTENHAELKRPVTVVSFRGEEANILGGTFGSRAFCGMIDFNDDFIDRLKRTPFSLQQVKDTVNVDQYSDYIELHIEQGKTLEKDNINIGIVNTIAGIKRLDVTVHGESAHSGTMAMTERDDALTHTANVLLNFEKIVKSYGPPNVGTVGELFVHPNLPNVVPGKVEFVLEVRGTNIKTMHDITEEVSNYARQNHNVTIKPNVEKHPSDLSEIVLAAAEETCQEIDMSYHVMASGANHDANSLSTIMNSGLIFIPCLNGVSHNPKEYAAPTDIENGANTLLGTTLKLV